MSINDRTIEAPPPLPSLLDSLPIIAKPKTIETNTPANVFLVVKVIIGLLFILFGFFMVAMTIILQISGIQFLSEPSHPVIDVGGGHILLGWIVGLSLIGSIVTTCVVLGKALDRWGTPKVEESTVQMLSGTHPTEGEWQLLTVDNGIHWVHYQEEDCGVTIKNPANKALSDQATATLDLVKWSKKHGRQPNSRSPMADEKELLQRARGNPNTSVAS